MRDRISGRGCSANHASGIDPVFSHPSKQTETDSEYTSGNRAYFGVFTLADRLPDTIHTN